MLFFDLIFCILFVDFHIFSFPSFLSYIFFKIFTILSNIYICSFKYIYICSRSLQSSTLFCHKRNFCFSLPNKKNAHIKYWLQNGLTFCIIPSNSTWIIELTIWFTIHTFSDQRQLVIHNSHIMIEEITNNSGSLMMQCCSVQCLSLKTIFWNISVPHLHYVQKWDF